MLLFLIKNAPNRLEFIYLKLKKSLSDFGSFISIINLDASTAKSLEGKLYPLIVGKIISPYYSMEEISPSDRADALIYEFRSRLYFDLTGIWIINKETGEIVTKKFVYKKLNSSNISSGYY